MTMVMVHALISPTLMLMTLAQTANFVFIFQSVVFEKNGESLRVELMSRQAVPSEGGGRCRAQFCGAAVPSEGSASVGASPEVCVCRSVPDGQVCCARETLVSVACQTSVLVQAGGLIAVGQRLAPMTKAVPII